MAKKNKSSAFAVEFDINLIKKEGYSPDIMVVVLEDSNLPKVAYKTGEKTVAGKTVVAKND